MTSAAPFRTHDGKIVFRKCAICALTSRSASRAILQWPPDGPLAHRHWRRRVSSISSGAGLGVNSFELIDVA
jgi:hypothetical protein